MELLPAQLVFHLAHLNEAARFVRGHSLLPLPTLFWHLPFPLHPPPFLPYRYYKSNGSIVNVKCKLIILISFQLDSDTKAVDSCRLLNLKQFLAVYKSIQTQVRERFLLHLFYNLIGFVPIQNGSDSNPYLGPA
jgi:hypothetical protein